ncbi:MAG: hypothetical protein QOH84_1687 [Kribbellaceae bacterium]|nr:hypothetical protein [Kribbellaceae bacterium]
MRIVIDAEGIFGDNGPKMAHGALRYRPGDVVAVIDSRYAGTTTDAVLSSPPGSVPIVADLQQAAAYGPDTYLVGFSLLRPSITDYLREQVLRAIGLGLEIVSGLHYQLTDDAEIAAAAAARGVRIRDLRRPERAPRLAGRLDHRPGSWTTLAVGSDSSVGKMTTMLELDREAVRRGLSSTFVATGQTGIMIADRGVPADHIVVDFLSGSIEEAVLEAAEEHQFVFVEGQGSLNHPAYSALSLGILHGTCPDAMILCHRAGAATLAHYPHQPLPSLTTLIAMHDQACRWLVPAIESTVVGISLNTSGLTEQESRHEVLRAAEATGLPVADVVRSGAGTLLDAVVDSLSIRSSSSATATV